MNFRTLFQVSNIFSTLDSPDCCKWFYVNKEIGIVHIYYVSGAGRGPDVWRAAVERGLGVCIQLPEFLTDQSKSW
jgi:hypothetical protein